MEQPQNIKVKRESRSGLRFVYDVVLKEQSTDIGQVVVTGFAKTEIRKNTGSVAVIEGKDLKTSPLEGVDKLLQGKLAGVSVQSVSGRPGEAAKIRIRGTSTITGNAEPLWVIDGVPMQKSLPTPPVSNSQIRSGDFFKHLCHGSRRNQSERYRVDLGAKGCCGRRDLWFAGSRRCDRRDDQAGKGGSYAR